MTSMSPWHQEPSQSRVSRHLGLVQHLLELCQLHTPVPSVPCGSQAAQRGMRHFIWVCLLLREAFWGGSKREAERKPSEAKQMQFLEDSPCLRNTQTAHVGLF